MGRVGRPGIGQSMLHVRQKRVSTPQDRAQDADSAGDRQIGTMRMGPYTVEGSRVNNLQEIRGALDSPAITVQEVVS
jgi:uncharacterized protein YaiE (UPF0345 family)